MPTFEDLCDHVDGDVCLVVYRRYNLFDIRKYKDMVRKALWTGEYFADGKTGWGCGKIDNVTHWMPFPSPPTHEEV